MKHLAITIIVFFFAQLSCAQEFVLYEKSKIAYDGCVESFSVCPTNQEVNAQIYDILEQLLEILKRTPTSQQERSKINTLIPSIEAFIAFLSPIAGKYNAHLSENQFRRLDVIFDDAILKTKLRVQCPEEDIEFIEVQIADLRMSYLHCISKKSIRGLRARYKAREANQSAQGEYGVEKNKFTPLLHNVGKQYLRITSASISEYF